MAHGAYVKRRGDEPRPPAHRSKPLGVDKGKKKMKPKPKQHRSSSLKNQIRSIDRLLGKNIPPEMREAQEQKLEELKRQQDLHTRLAIERKIHIQNKRVKFIERRKIERMIRRLEKQQRSSTDQALVEDTGHQLTKLKEDLEYIKFFPKAEKYVSLLVGGENPKIVEKRNKLRKQIKANIVAAAASGKDLEETASDDDALDLTDDDFFANSSSDEAEADDELTDKNTREPASSASGKATSGMSSDEKNQRQISARALMPPPRTFPVSRFGSMEKTSLSTSNSSSSSRGRMHSSSRNSGPASRFPSRVNPRVPSSSNTSQNRTFSSSRSQGSAKSDNSSNLSSNSDAHKPKRKRRPKKKKQA